MSIDILMVTFRSPSYVHLSLRRLLSTCDDSMRVWLWQNGSDEETLAVVNSFADHPRVSAFHHSPANQRLLAPTNWMWARATGDYVAKVDDDCLVDFDWAKRLRMAHEAEPRFGVLGSWRFYEEDFYPQLAEQKIATFAAGHRVMLNAWVQGSGYLMKRRCIEEQGLLQESQAFTSYCVELAHRGYVNGWYYPFIHEEHFDDPRSEYTALQSDADFLKRLPLSAQQSGVTTLEGWEAQMRRSARHLQAADPHPRHYRGWRLRFRNARKRFRRREGEL